MRWLTLAAPELARSVRAGQYLLVRCAEDGSYDPLLRRPLFVAAAEPALGQVGLLYAPSERGLAWLARGRPGDTLDIIGPLGHPFAIAARTRNLLLIGQGPGLAALLLLARTAAARDCAVTLLVGAGADDDLPPPFLLPAAVEYQSVVGPAISLLGERKTENSKLKTQNSKLSSPLHPIAWADQVFAALPDDQITRLYETIHAVKYRWERGFASVLREGPIVCGVGACGVCAVALRRGSRLLCSDGPVFDLRDVVGNG